MYRSGALEYLGHPINGRTFRYVISGHEVDLLGSRVSIWDLLDLVIAVGSKFTKPRCYDVKLAWHDFDKLTPQILRTPLLLQ